jgi:anaerobic ribonucleoside-triphosphate reductase activating protein
VETIDRMPRVGGIVPFSALDYPGKLSAVVFLQGCPWRCGYCHNPHLQPVAGAMADGWNRVRALLDRREQLIEAVVFSGGEPTADTALVAGAREVRDRGLRTALHTAGVYPRRLRRALADFDWVGMDVKAPFRSYDRITHIPGSGRRARASVDEILKLAPSYEFRTTYHASLLREDEVFDLASTLSRMGARHFALQSFRAEGCADKTLRRAPVAEPGAPLLAALRALFPHFTYRSA